MYIKVNLICTFKCLKTKSHLRFIGHVLQDTK